MTETHSYLDNEYKYYINFFEHYHIFPQQVTLVGCLGLWHIKLCRLFNAKSIFIQIITSFKQFSLAWVHSLIVKNISISNYSVYSNSSKSANSV